MLSSRSGSHKVECKVVGCCHSCMHLFQFNILCCIALLHMDTSVNFSVMLFTMIHLHSAVVVVAGSQQWQPRRISFLITMIPLLNVYIYIQEGIPRKKRKDEPKT